MSHADTQGVTRVPEDPSQAASDHREQQGQRPLTPGCGCGAAWPGNTVCHCSRCHITFTSAGTFDKHRKDGKCCTPAEVGLELKERAGYAVWGTPDTDGYWTARYGEGAASR